MDAGALAVARALGIGKVGTTALDLSKDGDVIYRLPARPAGPAKYQYLVVSDRVEDAQRIDLLTVRDLDKIMQAGVKKAGIGLEVEIAPARKMDAAGVAGWLSLAQKTYEFCRSSGCQFVLSSGATSPTGVVSGRCMDALLRACGINPQKHWVELAAWLSSRLWRAA